MDAELLPPVELKGKAAPMTVYRLREVRSGDAIPRRLQAPLIGRQQERRLLTDAWDRVASERTALYSRRPATHARAGADAATPTQRGLMSEPATTAQTAAASGLA